jgi:hypothetical protein
VDAHPHADVTDRLGPRVTAERPLRGDRGLDRGAGVDEVGIQRVALAAVHMAARTLDSVRHERVVLVEQPRPLRAGRARQTRRALDVGEQHRHDTRRRVRGLPIATRRCFERRIVAQDRLLQPLQLRRGREPELLIQPPPPAGVDVQRVGLAAAAIQRQHQQTDQPLA